MTNCLVLGGADCVFKDIDAALELGEFDGVVAVNDVCTRWSGELDAAVSLHGEKWPLWLKKRSTNGYPKPKRVFVHSSFIKSTLKISELVTDSTIHTFSNQPDSGSSGLFGVKVALIDLGYDRVVCCGVPMLENSRHFFSDRPWGGAQSHRRGWTQAKKHLEVRVRSMSGWTADLLGKPTSTWLIGGD